MKGTIGERLAAGKLVRVMAFGGLANPKLVEMAGTLANIHGAWFDQEHSDLPHAQLELLAMACRAAGIDAFARVPPTNYTAVMRPLEAGCAGVMVAQIRTMDEVREAASWARYPPQGRRGVFTSNVESRFASVDLATHVAAANRDRWLALQIETSEAVDLVDEIAAHDGIDWLFVGPHDLSVNLGVPGEVLHEKCVAALQRVSAASAAAGKPWGALCPSVEHARLCRELGCGLLSLHGDSASFRHGLAACEEKFAEFMD